MSRKPEKAGRKKGRLLRLLFEFIGVFALTLLLLALAAKFWLIPAVVRARLLSLLDRVWQGTVHIEHIDVDYSGPFRIKGLTLSDAMGRRWLHIPTARLIQTNWPGFKPVITGIDIDQFKVHIFLPDEGSGFPLKSVAPKNGPPKGTTLDLRNFSIRDIAITIADPCGQTAILDNLTFSAVRDGSSYNLSLTQTVPKPTEAFYLRGTVDSATSQINLWADVDHTLTEPETVMLFAALSIPLPVVTAGRVDGSLAVACSTKDPNTLKITGAVKLGDWKFKVRDDVVATDGAAELSHDGTRCDFENITAAAYGGQIDGSFYVTLNPGGAPTFGGQFQAHNIEFEQLTSALLGPEKTAKGTLMFKYSFTEDTGDLQNLQGQGQLLLNDAQMYVLPLTANIFHALGLEDLTRSRLSDVHAAFHTTGPEVTLDSAHLANRLLAIQTEPGGTINLQTGNLDLYLIG
ncbi:MAG: AsmA family protein, partial [Planctomycetota bacterium]